jgi:hypothetical protein
MTNHNGEWRKKCVGALDIFYGYLLLQGDGFWPVALAFSNLS